MLAAYQQAYVNNAPALRFDNTNAMPHGHIFISHTSADDAVITALRNKLTAQNLFVWDDARKLRGGDALKTEISEAIAQATHFIVVLSQNVFSSKWVIAEIKEAMAVAQTRDERYKVIPLLLPDVNPAMLQWLNVFPEEKIGIVIPKGTDGLDEATPQILAAPGMTLPGDATQATQAPAAPLDELILKLYDPRIETADGETRALAMATLVYEPADGGPRVESTRYHFRAPLGPIEAEELRWYLEQYYRWPAGLFRERAARIESQLPAWGHSLYRAALDHKAALATDPALNYRDVVELTILLADLGAGA
ncbi:MAG: toll/interleukin-1 receptor domain-containing protein [Blastocatellia bacterium]